MQPIVNPAAIRALQKREKRFAEIIRLHGLPPSWSRPQGFESLAKIILEQQVSLESANAHFRKLRSVLPAFVPEELLKLNDEQMRACQVSRQKTKYLRALAEEVLSGKLNIPALEHLPEPEIRAQLTEIKGIGNWTADIYLMFCLQSPDIFPAGDIAVIQAARELFKLDSKEAVIAQSENWKPYRSLAAYLLWHSYLKKRNRNPVF
jgi:DNA-3-methyladenine glycosylase II